MWDWSSDAFQAGQIADQPALASFVSGLVVKGSGGLDVNRSILSRYRMRALPLIEWDLSPDASSLFRVLKQAGAMRGFFIGYPGEGEDDGRFYQCDLSPESAAIVAHEDMFGLATIFVDDLFLSAVAAWFTDFTFLCMSPGLFESYLAASTMFLDLYGGDTELPAETFQAALRGAFTRLDQWSPSASALRSELDWQLIRSAPENGS